ncbi:MAG: hypothetical protein ACYSXF_06280 [Planctomycetota bacterium]|jgi:hypothetical protein
MDDPSEGVNRFALALLAAALIAGAWYWWHHAGAPNALEQVTDVFAPASEDFNERQEQIDRAKRIVDRVNHRQRGQDAPE